uniref:Uncharacterized protein n=1 Tax=Anguilla anguilla TaxID=7936 RepID=A0A0E9UYP4_ANGAN
MFLRVDALGISIFLILLCLSVSKAMLGFSKEIKPTETSWLK